MILREVHSNYPLLDLITILFYILSQKLSVVHQRQNLNRRVGKQAHLIMEKFASI